MPTPSAIARETTKKYTRQNVIIMSHFIHHRRIIFFVVLKVVEMFAQATSMGVHKCMYVIIYMS